MQVETRVRFPEIPGSDLTFHADRVEGGARDQVTLTRDQLRSISRTVLWHALTSDEFLEGNVNGKRVATDNELELRVGNCEIAMLYCAKRDVVVARATKAFKVTRVEFAWIARAQLDWVESLSPAAPESDRDEPSRAY